MTRKGPVQHSGATPPPGWYPDPAGTRGRAYWNGREWSRPQPPTDKRTWIVVGSVFGVLLMLILLGNCSGDDQKSSVASTVTKTVTVTAQPPTVTVTAAPPPIVTATEAPPPRGFFEPPAPETAPPPASLDPPAPPPVGLPPPPSSSVYYADCGDARSAGAAPLYVGEPGYRSGLDRDGDGVACES